MEKKLKLRIGLLLILFPIVLSAQSFQIGHKEITLNDPSRSRDILCHFYYPSTIAGNNVAVASGQFPLIVFGHGFSMSYEAYMNFVDSLVPHGFVMCFPTTESGLLPNHLTFGIDLQFLNNEIKSKTQENAGFFLYQKLTDRSAIMGHSMGGGAAFLAAENNTNLTTLVTFAAAETSVSAIAAAANISVPAIVFMGENDGVAPPAEHQGLMYHGLPSGCKGYIAIRGGGHCYFANDNLACTTAEFFTSPKPTISREEQHEAIFHALIPYLQWMLNGDGLKRQVFESIILESAIYSSQFDCSEASINEFDKDYILFPNPVAEVMTVRCEEIGRASCRERV